MDEKLKKRLNDLTLLFEDWADAIFLNVDKDFIQDNSAENKIYRMLTSAFQENDTVDLKRIRNSQVYENFADNLNKWGELYQNRFMQSRAGADILQKITTEAEQLIPILTSDDEIMHHFGKTLSELVMIRKRVEEFGATTDRAVLEYVLLSTFNLIEKAYVELAYSLLDDQIEFQNLDEEEFWEEPIMEYILETWWPKRRTYTNKILLINITDYPDLIHFKWKEFMSQKFYSSGIFGFLKQLRNLLTHVKTSKYHEQQTEQLFNLDFLAYWSKMNTALVIYIVAYLKTR